MFHVLYLNKMFDPEQRVSLWEGKSTVKSSSKIGLISTPATIYRNNSCIYKT